MTLIYYDETVLPFLRWLEADGVARWNSRIVFGAGGRPHFPILVARCAR